MNQRLPGVLKCAYCARIRTTKFLGCPSSQLSFFTGLRPGLLVDENVHNALTNLADMKMILLPFLEP